jgi:excisionase family DNA binding protein
LFFVVLSRIRLRVHHATFRYIVSMVVLEGRDEVMNRLEERYYSVNELAERLRVHPATVRRWLLSGELRGVRLPGGWRVSEEAVREFLEERGRSTQS